MCVWVSRFVLWLRICFGSVVVVIPRCVCRVGCDCCCLFAIVMSAQEEVHQCCNLKFQCCVVCWFCCFVRRVSFHSLVCDLTCGCVEVVCPLVAEHFSLSVVSFAVSMRSWKRVCLREW